MDSKVTALERAFQLARSGKMATIEDIKKRLKQEGYDERVVTDGRRSLTMRLWCKRWRSRQLGAWKSPSITQRAPHSKSRERF
jgi:hypothetical protein